MPGQKLRPGAWCPLCGRALTAVERFAEKYRCELKFVHAPSRDIGVPRHYMRGSNEDMDRIHYRLVDDGT